MLFILAGGLHAQQPCTDVTGLIQVSPPALDFGDVSVGSSKSLSFRITNVDPASGMNILILQPQNSRFQIVGAPHVPFCITPGKSIDIQVVFTPKQAGVVVSKIRIDSTGGQAFVGTSGNGTGGGGGGGSLKVSPSSIDFGKVHVGDSLSKQFSITNQGSSSADIDKINSSNSAFKVTAPSFPKSLQPGATVVATVAFTPTKSGSVNASLSVISGGGTAATVGVSGEGSSGTPNISLNPTQMDFGSTDVGTFNLKTLVISNTGNAPLQVSFPSDPFVKITPPGPVTIEGGKSASFGVKLIADALGHINKNINVQSNDPDTPKAPLNLQASGVQGQFGFVNRTARSRIGPNPNATSALQFVDFDLDGKTDLYLTGHDGNLMCKNNGGAQFSNSTNTSKLGNNGKDSRGVTWGDVDNDGDLDVFIANFNSASVILKNNHNVFTPPPGGVSPSPGLFAADATTKSTGSIFVDINNDKLLDVFVIKDGENNQLFKNLGTFRFADIAPSAGLAFKGPGRSAVAADFNGDGFTDLYVANFKRPNKLYINNKNETFRDVAGPAGVGFTGASVQAAAVDFDADGDIDIFVVNKEGPSVLFRNQGNLKFQNVAGAAGLTLPKKGSSSTWSDFDRDGDMDVIIAQSPGENMLFRNNGNGKFTRIANVDLSNADDPSAVVNGDSDNDGDTDVAIGDEDGGPNSGDSIYQNTGGGGNNFLVLTLQGTRSNATAIGAKVIVRSGALIQAQLVSGGDGKNQSSLPLEFGLGNASSAQVIVAWPSGTIQTLDNVGANQKVKIVEPAS